MLHYSSLIKYLQTYYFITLAPKYTILFIHQSDFKDFLINYLLFYSQLEYRDLFVAKNNNLV